MKLYSPFLLVLILTFGTLVSCNDSKHSKANNTIVADRIVKYIKSSNDPVIPPVTRLKYLEQAYDLAKKNGNDTLIYTSLASKSLLVNEYFLKDSPRVLKELYNIVKNKKDKHYAYYQVRLADYFLQTEQYDSAYSNYDRSKTIYLQEKDSMRVGYNFVKIAWIYMIFNDYKSTEDNAVEALKVLKGTSNKEYRANIYFSLGNAFLGLKQYDEALENYSKADTITTDKDLKLAIQNNKANVYISTQDYKKAISILSNVVANPIFNESRERAAVLDNLGYAKFKKGDRSGIIEMENAMLLSQKKQDTAYLAKSYLHFSDYYSSVDNELAIMYAHKANDMGKSINSPGTRIEALKKLFILTSGETCKVYGIQLDSLKDSVADARAKQTNSFAKAKYDLSDRDNKIRINKIQNENNQIIVGIVLFILISTGIALYYLYRAKYRREKLKEIYNTETRISKKLHDELANDVYSVMTFAGTKELSVENKENLMNKLEDIYSRTRNISKENASIDTGPAFGFHFKEMIGAYSNNEVSVITKGLENIDWNTIDSNKKVAVYRVVHELLVNMKKHSKCSFAVLNFEKIKNNLHIDYSDNGVGQTAGPNIPKNGLQNVENRIHAIKGTITFDTISGKGFKLSIAFPI